MAVGIQLKPEPQSLGLENRLKLQGPITITPPPAILTSPHSLETGSVPTLRLDANMSGRGLVEYPQSARWSPHPWLWAVGPAWLEERWGSRNTSHTVRAGATAWVPGKQQWPTSGPHAYIFLGSRGTSLAGSTPPCGNYPTL